MAITNNISFCGKYFDEILGSALYDNDVFGTFSIAEGIKSAFTLPLGSLGNVVVGDSCTFTDSATIQLDPRSLNPCTYKYNDVICTSEMEPLFNAYQLANGAQNGTVYGTPFQNWVVRRAAEEIGNVMQTYLWGGTSGCQGLFNILGGTGGTAFQGAVLGVTAAAGVTAGNVVTELNKMIQALPGPLVNRTDLTMYLSPDMYKAYISYATTVVTNVVTSTERVRPSFAGIPIVMMGGNYTRRALLSHKRNLWIGTDMMDDKNEIRVVDHRYTTNEDKISLSARWRWGVQVAYLGEAVYYA